MSRLTPGIFGGRRRGLNGGRRERGRFGGGGGAAGGDDDTDADLAFFKRAPFPCDHIFQPERSFFVGACEKCTPISKSAKYKDLDKLEGLRLAEVKSSGFFHYLWAGRRSEALRDAQENAASAETSQRLIDSICQDEDFCERLCDMSEDERREKVEHIARAINIQQPCASDSAALATRLLKGRKVVYHPGQLAVIKAAQGPGHPFLFVTFGRAPFNYSKKLDAHLAWALLHQETDLEKLRLMCFREEAAGLDCPLVPVLLESSGRDDEAENLAEYVSLYHLQREGGVSFVLDATGARGGTSPVKKELLDDLLVVVDQGVLEDVTVVPFAVASDHSTGDGGAMDGEGMVRIDFDQPFSLKEYVNVWNSSSRNLERKETEPSPQADDFVQHLLTSVRRQARIMTTELLAFIRYYENNLPGKTLLDKLSILRQELTLQRRKDVGFSGENEDVLNFATDVLQESDSEALFPLCHNITMEFAKEALAAAATLAIIRSPVMPIEALKGTRCPPTSVEVDELVEATLLLYHITKVMLPVIKPCDDARQEMADAVSQLKVQDLLFDPKEVEEKQRSEHLQAVTSRRLAKGVDRDLGIDDVDADGGFTQRLDAPMITICVEPESVEQLLFLRSLIDPYVHTLHEVVTAAQRSALDEDAVGLDRVGADLDKAGSPHVKRCLLSPAVSQLEAMGVVRWNRGGSGFSVSEEWRHSERLTELRRVVQAFM